MNTQTSTGAIRSQLDETGYAVLPFPQEIVGAIGTHIARYLSPAGREVPHDHDALTALVMSLDDASFKEKMQQPLRMLPDEIAQQIQQTIAALFPQIFGPCRASMHYLGPSYRAVNPTLTEKSYSVYWRCVRPGKKDVGLPHADGHYWTHMTGPEYSPPMPFEYDERWKVWFPVAGCTRENTLQVIPGSHLEDVPFSLTTHLGNTRPGINEDWLETNEANFYSPFQDSGTWGVLFHDNLVHRGPMNPSPGLRVSAEFTVVLKYGRPA